MKNFTEFNHLVSKEQEKNKKEIEKVIAKFEKKFGKGKTVVTHHFESSSPDLMKMVKNKFEEAGYNPEFSGSRPGGHVKLTVDLMNTVSEAS
ncbi:MAG: hypothetical protein N4A49_03815 [Marinifilaceae bacterium]|jgi:hypothetical protein|nr:hypothetical protein [Marinifilaceae bacterium]